MLLHCLSNSLTARTSTLYLFSIFHLQAVLKYVLADLKLKATLVEICAVITRANTCLENYSCHLTVGQAYLRTPIHHSPAPGIRHSTCSVFLQNFSFALCPVQLHHEVLVPAVASLDTGPSKPSTLDPYAAWEFSRAVTPVV